MNIRIPVKSVIVVKEIRTRALVCRTNVDNFQEYFRKHGVLILYSSSLKNFQSCELRTDLVFNSWESAFAS